MEQFKKVYKHVYLFMLHVPTYTYGHYGAILGTDTPLSGRDIDWDAWAKANIETSYYSPEVHAGAFALPPRVAREAEVDAKEARETVRTLYRGVLAAGEWAEQ